eukprot:426330-Karenia_brevis.AAC.1
MKGMRTNRDQMSGQVIFLEMTHQRLRGRRKRKTRKPRRVRGGELKRMKTGTMIFGITRTKRL